MVKNNTILLDRTECPPGELPPPGAGNTGSGRKLRSNGRSNGRTARQQTERRRAQQARHHDSKRDRQSNAGRAPDEQTSRRAPESCILNGSRMDSGRATRQAEIPPRFFSEALPG